MKPKEKSATRCVVYLRYSPRRRDETCESNAVQLAYCRKYAAAHGYEIVEVFADEQLSGDDEDRQGLWDAINSIEPGMVLLCYKPDRLARSVYLSEHIHRELAKRRAVVEVVEGRNGEDPDDVLVRQIMAAVAEHEKKIISARTKAAMLRHQATGRAMGSVPPIGWKRGPDRVLVLGSGEQVTQRQWVEDEGEQKAIRRICEERAKGTGYGAIGKLLVAEGLLCRGRAKWPRSTIQAVLARHATGEGVAG